MYSTLKIELKNGAAVVTLNRPGRLNAINRELTQDMERALNEIYDNQSIRVVVITGEGGSFCSGADIADVTSMSSIADFSGFNRRMQEVYQKVVNLDRPVIAAINGTCMGGGLELALCCDFRFASASAQFAIPEINIGVLPAAGGIARLYRLIGICNARELLYTGRRVVAEEALKIGLVDRMTPAEDLLPFTLAFAVKLAAKAPLALSMAKTTLNACIESGDISSALELELRTASLLFMTDDRKEGMSAFLEKRPPRFKGC